MNSTFHPRDGDLVLIDVWDCEGVERPWGWDAPSRDLNEVILQSLPTPRIKRKIQEGSLGIVTQRIVLAGKFDQQVMYWCIVEGNLLLIQSRFIYERKEV